MATVVMNIKNDPLGYGESRSQPFIMWLQLLNFAMVSALCWIALKIYRSLLSLYEWIFPLRCYRFCSPLVLVIGTKSELNAEIVRQLSEIFDSAVIELTDVNDNFGSTPGVDDLGKRSRIIYTQVDGCSRQAITRLSSHVRDTYGEIDLLFISQNEEPANVVDDEFAHAFLVNLNKQLLTQFWIVMAFLPGMLQRNHGHIISVALGKTAYLTNTGIVRSVCEQLLLTETDVRLKLVERNSFLENYLPALPNHLSAKLIIRSIWTSSTFVRIPSTTQYLLTLPQLVAQFLLQSTAKILNCTTSTQTK